MIIPDNSYALKASRGDKIKICILGSTGSIGKTALDVARRNRECFTVVALTANSNAELLAAQVKEFSPRYAVITDQNRYRQLKDLSAGSNTEILCGETALCQVASMKEADVILAAIVGVAGLAPVLSAAAAGKLVALANKESLVAGGALVSRACTETGARVIPVDSEHSAIFQLLGSAAVDEIRSLTLTASGGPFLKKAAGELRSVTPEQAVSHPRWNMGAKISIDSATLVNKALEVIEAHWLFNVPADAVNVIVHPQSIIHSIVDLVDGTRLAQMSIPDMAGAIGYALSYPGKRINDVMPALDLAAVSRLEFLELDNDRFPAVKLARSCIRQGGSFPAVFNWANEKAVEAFMSRRISFDRIVPLITDVLSGWRDIKIDGLEGIKEVNRLVSESFEKEIQG